MHKTVGTPAIQVYYICSIVCILLDVLACFFILSYFQYYMTIGAESKLAELFLNGVFWVCFYKWAAFARTLRRKLPPAIYAYLVDTLKSLVKLRCLKRDTTFQP